MSFTIECESCWHDIDADALATSSWLKAIGMAERMGSDKKLKFEIELLGIPNVLETFLRLQKSLFVSRITNEGVTFYLTDVPYSFNRESNPRAINTLNPNQADGWVFVPMANVVCVNSVGSIRLVDREP
jgi:hypothetical protein